MDTQVKEIDTTIDIKDDICIVTINLKKNQVNAYGTLQFAQEMCSRYYLTKQIQKQKEMMEEDRGRVKVILPQGVKLG